MIIIINIIIIIIIIIVIIIINVIYNLHTCITFKVKTVARQEMFESAQTLVKTVTDNKNDPQQPEHSRQRVDDLVRICNRTRATLRPSDPLDLSFTVIIIT